MYTQTYICITFSILLCFSCYVHAIRFASEDKYYVNNLVGLGVTNKNNISPKNHLGSESVFSVQNYGAKGDGKTDDTQPFKDAWVATCGKENGVMLVPKGFKYLLSPIMFNGGDCQASIIVQIDGEIVASPQLYKMSEKSVGSGWIIFSGFAKGLTIRGNGVVDGHGEVAWGKPNSFVGEHSQFDEEDSKSDLKHAMEIDSSNNVIVTGITIKNSPQMHISFSKCQYVSIFDFTISAPGDSQNTDGIHLTNTQHVDIQNSNLACGDDCISIQTGCSNVTIRNVHCGPGHGFSIGSLGLGSANDVRDIGVYDSTVTDASNGVRIKTWEGATGTVHNITFENIIMSNVDNPIVIEQYYCYGDEFCKPKGKSSGVAISDVTLKNITGTYTKRSVTLMCSNPEPCKDINVSLIDLSRSEERPSRQDKDILCSNAYGVVLTETNPSFDGCLSPSNVAAPARSL